jgi:hypothetical protein
MQQFSVFVGPTDDGGFTPPVSGAGGFVNASQGLQFYQGASVIADIPDFQRDYNLRDELITRIEEGRFSMMRVLLDYAMENEAYVTDDVHAKWYLDYKATARFYLKTMANQGTTAGGNAAAGTFVLASAGDAKRIQRGDLLTLMCTTVPTTRNAVSVMLDYVATPSGGTVYEKENLVATPLFEMMEVTEVNYTTGQFVVDRNVGGDGQTASRNGIGFTVAANATTDPGASTIRAEDAFFVKATRPQAEGRDDVTIWSSSNTWDYNYCQFVIRKWGVTDIQENVRRRGQPQGQYAKNRTEALEQYFEEMDYYAYFGFRKEETTADDEWLGHAGGFFEHVPAAHYVALEEPDYNSNLRAGDFTIKKFNKFLTNKFYHGSNDKIILSGEKFATAFAWMINNMTQNIPTIVDRWGVRGYLFDCSNNGRIFVVASDTLSLNGLDHVAIMLDPSTFRYGHLENMDTTIVDPLPSTNIHRKSGEIFNVFTFKRVNPDANWVFLMQPNDE